MTYKLAPKSRETEESTCVFFIEPDGSGVCIPFDPANTDYQQYLKFLEEGGQPLPADDHGQTSE